MMKSLLTALLLFTSAFGNESYEIEFIKQLGDKYDNIDPVIGGLCSGDF